MKIVTFIRRKSSTHSGPHHWLAVLFLTISYEAA